MEIIRDYQVEFAQVAVTRSELINDFDGLIGLFILSNRIKVIEFVLFWFLLVINK